MPFFFAHVIGTTDLLIFVSVHILTDRSCLCNISSASCYQASSNYEGPIQTKLMPFFFSEAVKVSARLASRHDSFLLPRDGDGSFHEHLPLGK